MTRCYFYPPSQMPRFPIDKQSASVALLTQSTRVKLRCAMSLAPPTKLSPAPPNDHQIRNGAAQTEYSLPERTVSDRLPAGDVHVSMTRVIAAWGFGAAFFNLTSGAIYTSFAPSAPTISSSEYSQARYR
jgi:hypothetical protein